MACRLDGAKPLSEPMLGYCQMNPKEQISVKLKKNSEFFIQENAFENVVCEMATILCRGRWVKKYYNAHVFVLWLIPPLRTYVSSMDNTTAADDPEAGHQ